jgi:hypothetical protein
VVIDLSLSGVTYQPRSMDGEPAFRPFDGGVSIAGQKQELLGNGIGV